MKNKYRFLNAVLLGIGFLAGGLILIEICKSTYPEIFSIGFIGAYSLLLIISGVCFIDKSFDFYKLMKKEKERENEVN